MSFKIFALAFVAILSVQGLADAKSIDVDARAHLARVIPQARVGLEILAADVAALQRDHQNLITFSQQLRQRSMEKINSLHKQFYADVQKFEATYGITECINEALPKVNALLEKTTAEIEVCIDASLGAAEEILAKIKALWAEVNEEVQKLIASVQECNGDINCIIDAGQAFSAVVKRIYGEIKELIASSSAEIKEAFEALIACATPTVENYVTEIQQISQDLLHCIIGGE